MASVDPTIATAVAAASSAKKAWDAMHATYANKSRTRIFSLRDQLARFKIDSQPITEYIQHIRSMADKLSTAGAPITSSKLIVKILSGLGPKFREISAAIRARDSTITQEESKKAPSQIAADAITFNKSGNSNNRNNRRSNNNNGSNQQWRYNNRINSQNQGRSSNTNNSYDGVRCLLCNKPGHVTSIYRSRSHNHFEAKANYVSGMHASANPWSLDSRASHHITDNPHNLQEYNGMEQPNPILIPNTETSAHKDTVSSACALIKSTTTGTSSTSSPTNSVAPPDINDA
ncbi:PREDICTED: M-phase inducer phosphatase-like [Nicotiana attenuata]|uniref:M-phase inducer phosphatase-like n=1 Tax=Nicotiana attenuata TaxID=49451 RepID=UPI0009058908|nr:PREDICTED: M-phase inducer phosphatase-like [Nicotiana attenuata]